MWEAAEMQIQWEMEWWMTHEWEFVWPDPDLIWDRQKDYEYENACRAEFDKDFWPLCREVFMEVAWEYDNDAFNDYMDELRECHYKEVYMTDTPGPLDLA